MPVACLALSSLTLDASDMDDLLVLRLGEPALLGGVDLVSLRPLEEDFLATARSGLFKPVDSCGRYLRCLSGE